MQRSKIKKSFLAGTGQLLYNNGSKRRRRNGIELLDGGDADGFITCQACELFALPAKALVKSTHHNPPSYSLRLVDECTREDINSLAEQGVQNVIDAIERFKYKLVELDAFNRRELERHDCEEEEQQFSFLSFGGHEISASCTSPSCTGDNDNNTWSLSQRLSTSKARSSWTSRTLPVSSRANQNDCKTNGKHKFKQTDIRRWFATPITSTDPSHVHEKDVNLHMQTTELQDTDVNNTIVEVVNTQDDANVTTKLEDGKDLAPHMHEIIEIVDHINPPMDIATTTTTMNTESEQSDIATTIVTANNEQQPQPQSDVVVDATIIAQVEQEPVVAVETITIPTTMTLPKVPKSNRKRMPPNSTTQRKRTKLNAIAAAVIAEKEHNGTTTPTENMQQQQCSDDGEEKIKPLMIATTMKKRTPKAVARHVSTKSMEDMIKITSRLHDISERIESMEQQRNLLESKLQLQAVNNIQQQQPLMAATAAAIHHHHPFSPLPPQHFHHHHPAAAAAILMQHHHQQQNAAASSSRGMFGNSGQQHHPSLLYHNQLMAMTAASGTAHPQQQIPTSYYDQQQQSYFDQLSFYEQMFGQQLQQSQQPQLPFAHSLQPQPFPYAPTTLTNGGSGGNGSGMQSMLNPNDYAMWLNRQQQHTEQTNPNKVITSTTTTPAINDPGKMTTNEQKVESDMPISSSSRVNSNPPSSAHLSRNTSHVMGGTTHPSSALLAILLNFKAKHKRKLSGLFKEWLKSHTTCDREGKIVDCDENLAWFIDDPLIPHEKQHEFADLASVFTLTVAQYALFTLIEK
jgi:hypothetical protein